MKVNLLQWAQRRNFTKYRLLGIKAVLDIFRKENIMTTEEMSFISSMREMVADMLAEWNANNELSKIKYIKQRS